MKNCQRFCLLVFVLCFCACVPTPSEEFVVYRGDDTLEQKLVATAAPEPAPDTAKPAALPFPASWRIAAYDINDRVRIEIDAAIVQKADGVYPIWRTREGSFSDGDMVSFAEKLLPKPVSVHTAQMTKEDWTRMFRAFLDEVEAFRAWDAAGRLNDGVDRDESGYSQAFIDEESAWYMEQIKNAPDTLPETAVSDYRGLSNGNSKVFRLADGRTAHVAAFDWTIAISMDCTNQGYVYTCDRYEHEKAFDDTLAPAAWRPVSMERTEADRMLRGTLETLGMTDFTVRLARQANLIEDIGGKPHSVATGWAYELVRDFGGYPQSEVPFEPDQNIAYGADDGFAANRFIMPETLQIMVSANGSQYVCYTHPKTVVGVETANARLLSWDEAKARIQNALKITAPMQKLIEQDTVCTMRIYRLLLTTYTIRVKNSDDRYEMPCWVVFYDKDLRSRNNVAFYDDFYTDEFWEKMRNDTILTHEVLLINAVDGSIVFTEYRG